jgi:hypothetical protein
VTCLALAPATSAGAATGTSITPALLQSNWYYHRLVSDAPVAGAPDVEPSNVPDGDLPVASRDGNGTASKLTTLAFDLPKDAAGGSFSAFDVTMTIDPAATNVVPSDLKLQAAFALRNWPNGKGGDQDTLNAPPFDDKSVATATVNSAGTAFVFHVAPIAQQWADDVNYGLELLPAKGYTTPFQVSFLGGKNVKATATYTAGAPVTTTVPTTPTQATTGGGTSLTTTPTTSLAGAPSLGLAPDTTAVAPALAPPVTAAPPATAPQLAAPAPASAPAAASRPLRHISKLPGTGMVLVGVAVLALLALLSIILGGEPVGVVVRRPSRLSAVLQGRAPRPAAGTPRPVPLA